MTAAARTRLSKSVVGEGEQAAVADVLRRGYLGMGEDTRLFESEVARYIGGGRSITCVATGTAALHLAVQACGIGVGTEVLVPSLTFVASFQAIAATGATPVSCEIDPATCTLDVNDAERRVTRRTRAIMPVHYASWFPNMADVYALAGRHGLRVIEDAAHAFGCTRDGKPIGREGDVVCFSFDGIKNITCGEGGAVVTSDDNVRRLVEDARLLGVQRDTEQRYRGARSWEFDVLHVGFRYHMSNIMAAIGRVQLGRFEAEFRPARVALARQYRERLAGVKGVKLFDTRLGDVVPHIQPVRVLDGRRDAVRTALQAAGIESGIHYKPNHLLSLWGAARGSLPVTEQVYEELLTLPLHPDLTEADVSAVVDVIANTLSGSPA